LLINNKNDDERGKKIAICFVMLHSYSLFKPKTNYVFGGSEVRGYLFGRGLSKLPDYEVSFVVIDHGQDKIEMVDGIKVYAHSHYKSAFLKKLWGWLTRKALYRLLPHSSNQLLEKCRVYEQVDADIYCTIGVHNLAAEIAEFCWAKDKKFLLFSGSDLDFSESYQPDSRKVNNYGSIGYLCYKAIMQANHIVTQTKQQENLLSARFGRKSVTINNPIEMDHKSSAILSEYKSLSPYVLWIGKSDHIKRPDLVLEIASSMPQTQFVMVMNRSRTAFHNQIFSEKPPNVIITEYVPWNKIEGLFIGAQVLLNTSSYEGFPNTYLQAGKYGVPIVSLDVDPDGFIDNYRCGICAHGSIDELKNKLIEIINSKALRETYSSNIYRYINENHALEQKIIELDTAIRCLFND